MKFPLVWVCAMMLPASGCISVSVKHVADERHQPPVSDYRLVVMAPDVGAYMQTAIGKLEPQEEWTSEARASMHAALQNHQRTRGEHVTVAKTPADAGADPTVVLELMQLHAVVVKAIRQHKFSATPLPTKASSFDWTLGELAVSYGAASGHDYALFVYAHDSFSSSGLVALQAAGLVGCVATSVCLVAPGGMQVAYASLVDLKTGQVVWFNLLRSERGDIRTERGARALVNRLIEPMALGQPPPRRPRRRS